MFNYERNVLERKREELLNKIQNAKANLKDEAIVDGLTTLYASVCGLLAGFNTSLETLVIGTAVSAGILYSNHKKTSGIEEEYLENEMLLRKHQSLK